MKVYVAEQPESCLDCKFCNKENYCCWLLQKDVREYRDDCPLKSLKDHDRAVKQHAYKKGYNDMRIQYELGDYTKQVRKEVCEEIAKKMGGKLVRMQPDGEFGTRLAIDWYDVNRVLDQIQGETE